MSNFGFSATAPATNPAESLAAGVDLVVNQVVQQRISSWFADLSNRDAKVREQARSGLMQIPRDDLEIVRRLVENNRPLAPSQSTALREIVSQVFLASLPYDPVPGRTGFLGVELGPAGFNPLDPNPTEDEAQVGVVVIKRMPGFCAYPHLLDGDVIVGATEAPNLPIRKVGDLTAIIGSLGAGQTVHLEVVRGGQQIELAIPLSARPIWAQQGVPRDVTLDPLHERQRQAEEFWEQEFAPLVEDGVL